MAAKRENYSEKRERLLKEQQKIAADQRKEEEKTMLRLYNKIEEKKENLNLCSCGPIS